MSESRRGKRKAEAITPDEPAPGEAGEAGTGEASASAGDKPEGVSQAEHERAKRARELSTHIQDAQRELELIEAGKHPELTEQFGLYEARMRESIASAEAFSKWQIQAINELTEYERVAAREICENAKRVTREKMEAEVQDRLRRLEEQVNTGRDLPSSQRKTRSKTKTGKVDLEAQRLAHAGRRLNLVLDPPIENSIAEEEILADLRSVHKSWLSAARKFNLDGGLTEATIRMERGRFVCGGETFERGELVLVTSALSQQEFYGSIQSVGSIEIGLRLADGTRSRVPITMLQQGRVTIRHQS